MKRYWHSQISQFWPHLLSLPSTVFLKFLGYMQVIYPPDGLLIQSLAMICPTWHSRVTDEIRC